MSEQKNLKNELLKNMIYIFTVMTILCLILDSIIYNKVKNQLYESIDKELIDSISFYTSSKKPIMKLNPRMICVIRDERGYITNANSIGRIYDEFLHSVN